MQHLRFLLCCILLSPLAACSQPQQKTLPADEIKKNFEDFYRSRGAELTVKSIEKTPVDGIYEMMLPGPGGTEILYISQDGRYVFSGEIFDLHTRDNLTAQRMKAANKVDFAALPFEKAVKEVRGKGSRKIAVFSDPDCPWCKRLEKEFAQMDDITIYTFLMPIDSLHPDAARKAEQIWCAPERTQAWIDWMRAGKMPAKTAPCSTPVAQTTALGESLGFNGTPALVFPDGYTANGYLPRERLEAALAEHR